METARSQPAVIVRPATPADQAGIDAVAREVHALHVEHEPEVFQMPDGPVFEHDVAEVLAKPGHHLLVAESSGSVVGYAMAELRDVPERPTVRKRRDLYVHQIGVTTQRRRGGVGRQLIESLQHIANEQGADWLQLDVWDFNHVGRAFFASCSLGPAYHRLRLAASPRLHATHSARRAQ